MMDADALRIARLLSPGPAAVEQSANPAKLILNGKRGSVAVEADALARLARPGLVKRDGNIVALSDAGIASLRRTLANGEAFQAQHRELDETIVDIGGEMAAATINRAESPLATIACRKDRNGKPFLSKDEFRAGERLRSDYTRGQLMARLGADWQAAGVSGGRGGRGGMAELTDAAIAARQRVEHAIRTVGPELSGILIDVCCYLKGLETVERERGWPVRSAKIVLKTALSALGRHYEPESGRHNSRSGTTLHWGTDDFRPSIR